MPSDSDFDAKLERLVHEQLRKLPLWKAPDSLAPRVLAALRKEAARPWWRRDWSQWPPAAKVLSAALALLLVAGVTGSGWFVDAQLSEYWQRTAGRLSDFGTSLSPLANAGLLLWTQVFQSVVIYGLVFLAVLYASCLGAGTLFLRIARQN